MNIPQFIELVINKPIIFAFNLICNHIGELVLVCLIFYCIAKRKQIKAILVTTKEKLINKKIELNKKLKEN